MFFYANVSILREREGLGGAALRERIERLANAKALGRCASRSRQASRERDEGLSSDLKQTPNTGLSHFFNIFQEPNG